MISAESTGLSVRPISPEEHLDHVRSQRSASFLQTPAWGRVKSDWQHESLGWFREADLVGAALVLLASTVLLCVRSDGNAWGWAALGAVLGCVSASALAVIVFAGMCVMLLSGY